MAANSPMELIPPTANQLDTIFQNINLNVAQHKRDTAALGEWLLTQPHLPHDLDDELLSSFIVGCKNSLERSKQTLDSYLTNRTSCPDFYQNRDPCDATFRRLSKIIHYFVLPGMTPEGYRVSVFCIRSPDVSPADFDLRMNAVKVLCSYDVRFLEDTYWAGDVICIDCQYFGLKLLPAVAVLPLLKKYIHCVSNSLPARYKKIIFINLSAVAEAILNLSKPFIKQKVMQRIITSAQDHTFLHNHVPKDMLPDEYGGQAGSIADLNDAWQLKVERHRDWFLKDMTRKVDESKRSDKRGFKSKEMFGIDGSFKTLTID